MLWLARMRRLGLLALGLLAVSCGPKAARIEFERPLPSREARVFLVAPAQKERIARSLREAGFELAPDILDVPYLLRVTVGVRQDLKPCGELTNVKYSLRHQSLDVVEISAKGWTGDCEPNVFDEMSRELMHVFTSGGARE